jgi:hypothetical protein
MSKGHVFLAQNSTVDYVRQACALALSIKKQNRQHNQTCIITNDDIPEEYKHAFDYIVPIPWTDVAKNSEWKIENRWKIIHATPFKENIVYDTDMLLLNSNDHWWPHLAKHELLFTSTVTDYRNNIVTSDFYRKTFTANNLPNLYVGAFYFKKTNKSYEFFKWLDLLTANWKDFYQKFLPTHPQKFCSMDVNAALAVKFMDCEPQVVVNNTFIPSFTHMKPALQGWNNVPTKWTSVLSSYFSDDCQLKVGNVQQQGLFHYVEDEFLTADILHKLSRQT